MTPREAFLGPQEVVALRRGRGPDRRRVAGRLPARDPQRAAGRAAHPRRRSTTSPTRVAHGGLVRGAVDRDAEDDPGGGARVSGAGRLGRRLRDGRLLDVLLCPPDNFRWLPTSAISKATLESGAASTPAGALAQHAELVSVYEAAGVRVPLPRARSRPFPTRCSRATRA